MTGDAGERDAPQPRAFAHGVGLVLQTVGVVLFLSSCCICASARMWERPPTQSEVIDQLAADPTLADRSLRDWLDDPTRTSVMLTVMFSTVGGLAMAGFGLGLQAERRRAPAGAVVVTAGLLTVLLVAAPGLWTDAAGWGIRLWHALACIVVAVLLVMSAAAWRQFRVNPPPTDVDIVPPGTKIPYSWYHDDPPEVRMAAEIAARRARLDAERAEIDQLERELKAKSQKREPDSDSSDL